MLLELEQLCGNLEPQTYHQMHGGESSLVNNGRCVVIMVPNIHRIVAIIKASIVVS